MRNCHTNTTENISKFNWLADTGSPRAFMDIHTAEELIQKDKNMKLEDYNGYMKLKCFNNQDIPIIGQIQIELRSGSWTGKNGIILVVKHKSQNLMARDILTKPGLTLTQQQATKSKKILNISENVIEQNITKWIFKKYPQLCTRLGRSKNHMAKSILKKEKIPTQHKGRRAHLHLVEKVENELQKLIEDNQIIRLEKARMTYSLAR